MAGHVDLQQFIIEKLAKLDPAFSSTKLSQAMSAVVGPLLTRLGTDPLSTDIESFIVQRLEDVHPNLDVVTPGSFLRDALVTPLVMLLEPLKREVQYLRLQKSLADFEALAEEEVDALLANALVTRKLGAFSYTTVRLFFSSPRAVGLDQTITFTSDSGVVFQVVDAQVYPASALTRAGNSWYLDVEVQSAQPTIAGNVPANSIRQVLGLDGVSRVTNLSAAVGGVTKESNEQVREHAERALTERSMNTARGIETALREGITGITSVTVVGFNDAAMQRDLITVAVEGRSKFVEGPTVYCTTGFKTQTAIYPVTAAGSRVLLTNMLFVSGVPEAVLPAVLSAKFVRVLDGNWGVFDASMVSRVRPIAQVYQASTTSAYIRLSDFSTYPAQDQNYLTTGVQALTDDKYAGYNRYAAGGITQILYTETTINNQLQECPIGAPLPFTDCLLASIPGAPAAAELGRDYLLLIPGTASYTNSVYTGVDPVAAILRATHVHPIAEVPAPGVIRVARSDAHLSRRVPSGTWVGDAQSSAASETINVIACGAPARLTPNGVDKDAWARNAGATISASTTGATADAIDATVLLHSSRSWAELGVKVGHGIALMLWSTLDEHSAVLDPNALPVWYAWGRVVSVLSGADKHKLVVTGLDWSVLANPVNNVLLAPVSIANSTLTLSSFRLFWTVFTHSRELVDQQNASVVSYDELAFLPAVRPSGTASALTVPGRYRSNYESTTNTRGIFGDTVGSRLLRYRQNNNDYYAVWLRLDKNLYVEDSVGVPAKALLSAEVVELADAGGLVDTLVGVGGQTIPAAVHAKYNEARFAATKINVSLKNGVAAVPCVVHRVSLPFSTGAMATKALLTNSPSVETSDTTFKNSSKHFGYLLPHYMGLNAAVSTTGHVLQLFSGETVVDESAYDVTLSGIPGGVPYSEAYQGKVTFKSNQLHIGGCTDVYLKTADTEAVTSEEIELLNSDLAIGAEILFAGNDGVVDSAATSKFTSPSLLAFLGQYFNYTPAGTSRAMDGLVLELVEPPTGAVIKSFRVVTNHTGSTLAVRIAPALAGITGVYTGVKFRLLRKISVRLDAPIVVHQQGSNLVTSANELTVTIPTGNSYAASPTDGALYLGILAGPDKGEYAISTKLTNHLVLGTAPNTAADSVPYKIYSKQTASVPAPVIKLNKVFVDDGAEGAEIPFKHPVYAEVTSIAGVNDDPLDETDFTNTTFVLASSTLTRTGNVGFNYDFGPRKIAVHDVIRFDSLDAPNKHFWVKAIANDGSTLTLDRASTLAPTSITAFKLGKPSVGTVSCKFLAPTYFAVDKSTVFTHTKGDGTKLYLRPSTQETGVKYQQSKFVTNFTVTSTTTITTSLVDLFKHNIKVGDKLLVLTKVLTSTAFTSTTRAQLTTSNKLVTLSIDDVSYSVVLSGTNPMTLSDVAAQFNQQLGNKLRAAEESSGNDYFLKIYCDKELQLTGGSAGILDALGFPAGNARDNTAPGIVTTHTISAVADTAPPLQTLTFGPELTAANGTVVFVKIVADVTQVVYPAEMALGADGLYSAPVKVTSYDPLTRDSIAQGSEVVPSGYSSTGYEIKVANDNYSYSTKEELSLVVDGLVHPPTAVGIDTPLVAARAKITVDYDTAMEISIAQTTLMQPSLRVVCNNPLARHYLPAYPFLSLVYSGGATEDEVKDALKEFFVTLYPNKTLTAFDVMSALSKLDVQSVRGPLEVAYLCYDKNRVPRLRKSTDTVSLPQEYHVMGELDYVTVSRGA